MKTFAFIITFFPFLETKAQINLVPFAGLNTTKMKNAYGIYKNGGTYGLFGLEIELRKKQKSSHSVYMTMVTGLSYLDNGFYYSDAETFSYMGTASYNHSVTDMRMRYWQVPLILRINCQPSPLVEDFQVFFGGGLSHSTLIKAHLAEQWTFSEDLNLPFAPTRTFHGEYSQDVTEYGEKNSLFQRFEIGMKYKRIQLTWRLSKSITDMYHDGLEDFPGLADANFEYIKAHNENGKTIEKYSELVFGFRIWK